MVFLADEWFDLLEGDISFLGLEGFWLEFPSDEPVRYIDVAVISDSNSSTLRISGDSPDEQ